MKLKLAMTMILSVVIVLFVILTSGCDPLALAVAGTRGSGKSATQARTVAPFHTIRVEGSTDIDVKVGPAQSVTLQADDNILPKITTEVSDGCLVISTSGSFSTRIGTKAVITVPDLDGVAIHGSGDVSISDVHASKFDVSIAGSGDVKAGGTTDVLAVSIAGSGDVDLADLAAKAAEVSISGSGDAAVNVSEKLKASVAGSGDVTYKGSPEVQRTVLGSGSVEPAH